MQMIMYLVFFGVAAALFVVFKKRADKTAAMLAAAVPQIEAAYRATTQPGESAPRIVSAFVGSGALRKAVMLGATERRIFIGALSPSPEVVVMDESMITLKTKTFLDQGNTVAVYTDGWEANVVSRTANHTWRIHPITGTPEEKKNLEFLLGELGKRSLQG